MAKTLESFAFPKMECIGRYPWSDWKDGRIWQVQRGTDFVLQAKLFRVTLYRKATEFNMRVHTSIVNGNIVVFQFYDKPES